MGSTLLMRKVFLLSAIFLVSILFSCKKNGKLSPNFDNGNLLTIFTDTFSIKSTIIEDVPSQTGLIPFQLLGVYNDPIFGVRSSSIYTNVGISGETNFGTIFTIDSLVLSLKVAQYYGNSASSFTVNAFELATPLSSSTSFFSNTYSAVQNTLLGSALFTPSALDSTLRIVITDQTLINNIQSDTLYADNTAFNANFKGLYIVSSDTAGTTPAITQGDGGFALFDFSSVESNVTIHYNNSVTEALILNNDVKTYSRFINDYSGTDIEKHLNNDASKNENRIYVSDMESVRTKIEVPYIKNLADEGNVSINKAVIVFTVETGTDASPNEILQALTLSGIDLAGNVFDLADASEGTAHFNGVYNSTSKSISFNITRHLQQIINGTITDYGMYLTPNAAVVIPNRVVFNSENSPTFKTKLEITYSKL
tara:strand:- start:3329 stop:4600 length:1272 start_codon:yes stop_codon:yes gene_type:complete